MGYMFPICVCPRELVHLWWEPVRRFGANIKDLHLSQNIINFRKSPNTKPEPFLDLLSRGVVVHNDAEIIVSAFSDASLLFRMGEGLLNLRGGFSAITYEIDCHLGESKNKNIDESEVIALATSLVRTFVASGARHEVGWKGFQKIYICSYEVICKSWNCLANSKYRILWHGSHNYFVNSSFGSSFCFPRGKVIDGRRSIMLHTGPGIDPFTHDERFYIAMDYKDSFCSYIVNYPLIAAINSFIVNMGATPLKE